MFYFCLIPSLSFVLSFSSESFHTFSLSFTFPFSSYLSLLHSFVFPTFDFITSICLNTNCFFYFLIISSFFHSKNVILFSLSYLLSLIQSFPLSLYSSHTPTHLLALAYTHNQFFIFDMLLFQSHSLSVFLWIRIKRFMPYLIFPRIWVSIHNFCWCALIWAL